MKISVCTELESGDLYKNIFGGLFDWWSELNGPSQSQH